METKGIYAGIDIGSLSAEAVILRGSEILGYSVIPTGANTQKAAQKCFEKAIKKAEIDGGYRIWTKQSSLRCKYNQCKANLGEASTVISALLADISTSLRHYRQIGTFLL